MEGTRDKSVTFIKIEDFHENIIIPDITLPNLEMLDSLNNLPFSKLINMQCDSVIEALLDKGDIPLDTITIQSVTEDNIGSLMFYYELLTSLVGELIDVNTYDQPGVEAGKIILKNKLRSKEE
jgi:glucose-6-phosphate isomerase